jgi:hypothetical protein
MHMLPIARFAFHLHFLLFALLDRACTLISLIKNYHHSPTIYIFAVYFLARSRKFFLDNHIYAQAGFSEPAAMQQAGVHPQFKFRCVDARTMSTKVQDKYIVNPSCDVRPTALLHHTHLSQFTSCLPASYKTNND